MSLSSQQSAPARAVLRAHYRQRVDIYRAPAPDPITRKAGVMTPIASGVRCNIYDAIATARGFSGALIQALGLAGGRDDHLGFCDAAVDTKEGDEWRTRDGRRYTVQRVESTSLQQVVVLTEVQR